MEEKLFHSIPAIPRIRHFNPVTRSQSHTDTSACALPLLLAAAVPSQACRTAGLVRSIIRSPVVLLRRRRLLLLLLRRRLLSHPHRVAPRPRVGFDIYLQLALGFHY